MNAIRTFFLRARHWQLFVLLVGLTCIAQVIVIESGFPSQDKMQIPPSALLAAVTCWTCSAYWFWCLGSFLHSLVRQDLRLSQSWFAVALVYPILYATFFEMTFGNITPAFTLIVFPFHLLGFYCLVFGFYFVSKTLRLAETNRPATFRTIAGPFILLWFFPVGVYARAHDGQGTSASVSLG